jgi:hypothetical protein
LLLTPGLAVEYVVLRTTFVWSTPMSKSHLLGTTAVFAPPTDEGTAAPETQQPVQAPSYPATETTPTGVSRKSRSQAPRAPADHLDAYTIREFCRRHMLTPFMFYKLQRDGQAPRVMIVGGRKLISAEAAARWRKSRERAATPRPERGRMLPKAS